MTSPTTESGNDLSILSLATDIVSSFVKNNDLSPSELPELIRSVYDSLAELAGGKTVTEKSKKPAISIKKSITEDHIICLEDGKKLKMLKRYIRTKYGLSPDQYRQRWGLPVDYPMVAPGYAKRRSEFAKKIGLGRGVGRGKK